MNKTEEISPVPTQDHRYFLYDPEENGMLYYRTSAERDAAARKAIAACIDDGMWIDSILETIFAGEVTHVPKCLKKEYRPEHLDDDGCDEEGTYWGDMEWRGNFTLERI